MTVVRRGSRLRTERRTSRKNRPCQWPCGAEIRPGDVYLLQTAYPGADGMEEATRPVSIAECSSCAVKYGRADLLGVADPRPAVVEAFNARVRVGSPVRYWTGGREGDGKAGTTWHPATLLSGHTPVAWVRDVDGVNVGAVALTHVEPVEAS